MSETVSASLTAGMGGPPPARYRGRWGAGYPVRARERNLDTTPQGSRPVLRSPAPRDLCEAQRRCADVRRPLRGEEGVCLFFAPEGPSSVAQGGSPVWGHG